MEAFESLQFDSEVYSKLPRHAFPVFPLEGPDGQIYRVGIGKP